MQGRRSAAAPGMILVWKHLINLYYFFLFVNKTPLFFFDNHGTGAAMQGRWSAAATCTGTVSRALEGASQAPSSCLQDAAVDGHFPGPPHLRSVGRDSPPLAAVGTFPGLDAQRSLASRKRRRRWPPPPLSIVLRTK